MPVSVHPVTAERLMAYLDGELSSREAANVEEHLKSCAECQALAAEFSGISESLQVWTPEEDHLKFGARWAAAVRSVPRGAHRRFPTRWLVAAGALAATVAVVALLPRSQQQQVRERRAADLSQSRLASPARSRSDVPFAPKVQQYAQLQEAPPPPTQKASPGPAKVVRTVRLAIAVENYGRVRAAVDEILAQSRGFAAELDESNTAGEGRMLTASLRVPAEKLDAALARLRKLGRVENESQRGEEVGAKVVDVEARLRNLRATDIRLTDLLRNRTGRLSDVLEVEEHLTSIREQIETTEAERKLLAEQIALSRVDLTVREEGRHELGSRGGGAMLRLRNATVNGIQNLWDTAVGAMAMVLSAGPILLAGFALFFWPVKWVWRRVKS